MLKLLVIGLGGSVGAITRYGLSGLAARYFQDHFPWGTLLVNGLGCLGIGAMMSLVEHRQLFSSELRLFLSIGFLGSLTTFSTMGYETLELLRDGNFRLAIGNVTANCFLGLGAVAVGWFAVKPISV